MPGIGSLRKFFGSTVSTGAGFAAGLTVAPALAPELQDLVNETWALHPSRVPDAGTLAEGVAQGQVSPAQAKEWAAMHGYGGKAFDALVNIANVGPGMAQAFNLWRRTQIDEPGFRRALKRAGLESEWIDDLWEVRMDVLDPAQLAAAVHRDIVPDPGLLVGEKPGGDRKVPVFPPVPIPVLKEAHASGYDEDHLRVLVGLQGLPMGSHEAAQAEFRGVITHDDYLAAIAQGNTRNEWAGAIRDQSRAIPSPTNYVEGFVRNWIDHAAMVAGAARHGMTPEDTELLFLIHGRPLTQHQVFIGLRRGGVYDGPTGHIPEPILKAMQEGNLRPEWYNLAFASLETLPTIMVIRQWLKDSGDTTVAHDWLWQEGWREDDIQRIIKQYSPQEAASTGTTATRSATTRATTAVSKAYIAARKSRAEAESELTLLGVPAEQFDALFTAWDVNREATIAAMTNTQIRNAFRNLTITEADAVVRLVDRGLTVEQATAYLTAKPGT